MMNWKHLLVLGGVAPVFVVSLANASVTYSYVTGATGSPTSFTATANSTIVIPVYFKETLTNGSTSIIATALGLQAGSFSVTKGTGASTVGSVSGSVSSNGSSFSGGAFTQNPGNLPGTYQAGSNTVTPGQFTGPTPDANGLIQFGAVTINTAGQGTSTTFTLADFTNSAVGGFTLDQDFDDLDVSGASAAKNAAYTGAANNPQVFTVVVPGVPEPGSLALLSLSGIGLLARRRRNS